MGKANPKSIVCFPFKKEDVKIFTRNIQEALSHPDVGEVLCMGYEKNECFNEIEAKVPEIEKKKKRESI